MDFYFVLVVVTSLGVLALWQVSSSIKNLGEAIRDQTQVLQEIQQELSTIEGEISEIGKELWEQRYPRSGRGKKDDSSLLL